MSAAPQPRHNIDIEEFERRLRAPEPKAPTDPLAELARLVGGPNKSDPLASLFGDAPAAAPGRREPTFEAPPAHDPQQAHPHGDLRGDLRGAFDSQPVYEPQAAQPATLDEFAHFEQPDAGRGQQWDETAPVPEIALAPEPPPARSKKPLYLTAAVIAAGFIGIGASLAWRGGPHVGGEAPTIKAASGPVKVQPPAGQSAEAPGRDSALLDKTAATPPVKQVVTTTEAPMDPTQAARSARIVSTNAGDGVGAAGVIPPPPIAAPQPPARPAAASGFPEPKKVKTVAVRADGSIISSETTATAPQPPVKPAAPAPAAQTKNATPKSVARVATTPKVEDESEPPRAAARPAPKPKAEARPEAPARVARAETDDAAPARAASGGGGFAVQLAAAGSEAEARQTAARLGQKFSEALGGRRPSFAKAADKDVYRVRVGGMSREAAVEACEKVKAAGGGCFVAKN